MLRYLIGLTVVFHLLFDVISNTLQAFRLQKTTLDKKLAFFMELKLFKRDAVKPTELQLQTCIESNRTYSAMSHLRQAG